MTMFFDKLPLSFWFEVFSFIVSICLIGKLKGTVYFRFIPFLFLLIIGEYIGAYYKYELHRSNGFIYNLLTLLQFSFWILFYRFFLRNEQWKMASTLFLIFFLVFWTMHFFIFTGTRKFNSYSVIVGAGIIILQSFLYFSQLVRSELNKNPAKQPMFWILSGAFFFFTSTFFYFSLYNYLRTHRIENGTKIFDIVISNMNYLLYSCISIGLLFVPKKK